MKVLVIGDTIVDEYVRGTKLGISAETPTIVAKELGREIFLGGAAFVVRNLLRLGCDVIFVTTESRELCSLFLKSSDPITLEEKRRLKIFGMPRGQGDKWELTKKKRFFVDSYKLLQFDLLPSRTHDEESLEQLVTKVVPLISEVDKIVFSDYRHGVIEPFLVNAIISEAENQEKQVIVDSQVSQRESNLTWYMNAHSVFLNERELQSFFGDGVSCNLGTLRKKLNLMYAFLKKGSDGLEVNSSVGSIHLPAPKVSDVVDTCGAGDCLLAAYVATGDLKFSQRWAAESTRLRGTVVPDKDKFK